METLVLNAKLEADGRFRLRRSYTTPKPPTQQREPRRSDGPPLRADVRDAEGNVVSHAQLRRHRPTDPPPGPPRWTIDGQLALRDEARSVAIWDDDVLVSEFELSDEPSLELHVERRGKGEAVVAVNLGYAPAADGAWMAVTVISDLERPRTVHLGQPTEHVDVDLSTVSGQTARIAVLYSTGTRSTAAVSEPVELEHGPSPLRIVQPADGAAFSPWDPIDCVAHLRVAVPEVRERIGEVVWSVDDERVGRGRLLTVGPLEEGSHRIIAYLHGDEASGMPEAEAAVSIRVATLPAKRPGRRPTAD